MKQNKIRSQNHACAQVLGLIRKAGLSLSVSMARHYYALASRGRPSLHVVLECDLLSLKVVVESVWAGHCCTSLPSQNRKINPKCMELP